MLQLCSSSLDNLTLVAIELGAVEPKAGASDEIGSGRGVYAKQLDFPG